MLAEDGEKKKSLLLGANESGPGRWVPLSNSKSISQSSLRLIEGVGGTLWVGGTKNYRKSMASGSLSDGYLAKIDREGKVIWDLDIARSRENAIQNLASLPSGDVVIVGREDDSNWLARVSKDGKISWEKNFGLGKAASVSVMGDLIVVAAFELSDVPVAGQLQSRVTLWRFNSAGELLGRQIVRDEVARSFSTPTMMKVIGKADAIYVLSAWTEFGTTPPSSNPLSVVKMDVNGHVLWKKEVSGATSETRAGPLLCVRGVVILADGGVLVDCPTAGGIKFFQLDRDTGETAQSFLPSSQKPQCDGLDGWGEFMIQHSEEAVRMFGNGAGCTWLQQVLLTGKK